MGDGADGLYRSCNNNFYAVYAVGNGAADDAECFFRQQVEQDGSGFGLFREGKNLNLPSAVKAIEMSRPWQSMMAVFGLVLLYALVMVFVMLFLIYGRARQWGLQQWLFSVVMVYC